MSDTNLSLAEVLKKGLAEKKAREDAENELRRIESERSKVSLGDLFKTVSNAKKKIKTVSTPKKQEIPQSAVVENKTDLVDEAIDSKEFKKIQEELKRLQSKISQIEKRPTYSSMGGSGGGGGEIYITRMQDVTHVAPLNGQTLVWSTSQKQFNYQTPVTVPATQIESGEEVPYSKRVDFVNDDLIYKGESVVGSLDANPVWRIHRVEIGSDGDVIEKWANGDSTFSNVWNDRASLTYI